MGSTPAGAIISARTILLLVGVLAVVLAAALVAPHPSSAAGAMEQSGTINVSIVYRAFGGAPPGPGVTATGPTASPAAGLEVCLGPVGGGPVLASATTDASGAAMLAVPPGSYWLYVPRPADPAAAGQPATIVTQMPDGTVVRAWRTVEVSADSTLAVQFALTVPQP